MTTIIEYAESIITKMGTDIMHREEDATHTSSYFLSEEADYVVLALVQGMSHSQVSAIIDEAPELDSIYFDCLEDLSPKVIVEKLVAAIITQEVADTIKGRK